MDVIAVLVVIALVVLVGAVALYFYQRNRRSDQLQSQFGPEYERAVGHSGRADGERELASRAERVNNLELRELTEDERLTFSERWRAVQTDFVDCPESAIEKADALVQQVMAARGYPVGGDFERRAADLSVQHAEVVQHYRQGHAISELHRQSPQSTEQLRQAMVHYRALYAELLGEVPAH